MEKNWTTIETLRRARHDWLNRMQIIKGNLELNRIDRVKGFIDEIIIESQNEARLSSLNMPKFSELLLTSNWDNGIFHCEFEIIDTFKGTKEIDSLISRWTDQYFEVLEKNLDPFQENLLAVSVCKKEVSDIRCSFHLQGKNMNLEAILGFLETSLVAEQTIDIRERSENELFFKMDIKFSE